MECGFGIPRDTFRLVGDPKRPRLVIHKTGVDHTERMEAWARKRVEELEKEGLCGYIFKSDSPSSGMERVKVYGDKGIPSKVGVGIFARIFMEHFPLTPVEEEGRLHDPVLRENFIERIFTCMRYCDLMEGTRQTGRLVDFHTKNKYLLMAAQPQASEGNGKPRGPCEGDTGPELVERYEKLLMEAMALKPTVAKHENVLLHIMGYFKKDLSADEKSELLEVTQQYKRGLIPLIVPVTLLAHYVRKYNQAYLKEQTYLNPHPMELMLRNHV